MTTTPTDTPDVSATTGVASWKVAVAATAALAVTFGAARAVPGSTPVIAQTASAVGDVAYDPTPDGPSDADLAAAALDDQQPTTSVRITSDEADTVRAALADIAARNVITLGCGTTDTAAVAVLSDTDLLVDSTDTRHGIVTALADGTVMYAPPVATDVTATLARTSSPHMLNVTRAGPLPPPGTVAIAGVRAIRIGDPADGPLAATDGPLSAGTFAYASDSTWIGRVVSQADGDYLDPTLPDQTTPPAAPTDDRDGDGVEPGDDGAPANDGCLVYGPTVTVDVDVPDDMSDDDPRQRLARAAGSVSVTFTALNQRNAAAIRRAIDGSADDRLLDALTRDVFFVHDIVAAPSLPDTTDTTTPPENDRFTLQVTRIRPDADNAADRCLTYPMTVAVDQADGSLADDFDPAPPAAATSC
jgi:hypothetical protein